MLVLFVSYLVPLVRLIWKTFLLLAHEHFLPSAVCACSRDLLCLILFLLPQRFYICYIPHALAAISKLTPYSFSSFLPGDYFIFFLSFCTVSPLSWFSYLILFVLLCLLYLPLCFIPTALVSDTEHDMS